MYVLTGSSLGRDELVKGLELGLGPDNILHFFFFLCATRTVGKIWGKTGHGRPFFIGSSRCGLSMQPDNPFATFFPLKRGIFNGIPV